MGAMRVLDIFAGAVGGWSLGMSRAGYRTVAACEIDPWRRAVFAVNHPDCRMYDDVRGLSASRLVSDLGYLPDVIVGSPPCQDVSSANTKGQGIDGTRSGLFWEWIRLVDEIRPVWTCAENSPRLRVLGYDALAAELEAIGYACWPLVVGADNAGANHRRKRVWIVAADARCWSGNARIWSASRSNQSRSDVHDQRCVAADDHNAAIFRWTGSVGYPARWPQERLGPAGNDLSDDPHPDRQGQYECASNGEMGGGMDGFAADADRDGRRNRPGYSKEIHRRECFAGRDDGLHAPHPHSPRHPLRPRERADYGEELPPALRAIGESWRDWSGGLACLAEACAAAGFGTVDDERSVVLAPGVRNRAIAALGDSIVPKIAEAIGRAMKIAA